MYNKAKYFISGNDIFETKDFDIKELQRGFSIYEVVKIINGIPLFFENHINRLYQSAQHKKTEIPFIKDEIKDSVYKLIKINTINEGRLKFAVRFYQSDIKLICFYLNPIIPSENDYKYGIKIISIKEERKNPNAKIINYRLRTKVNNLIKGNDIFEVLLVNNENIITECSKSNIFFIKDDCIYTPLSKDVLPGITGHCISEICRRNKINLKECNINFSEIPNYDAAFITGTSIAVLPVKQIDDYSFKSENKITHLLSDKYNNIVQNYIHLKKQEN